MALISVLAAVIAALGVVVKEYPRVVDNYELLFKSLISELGNSINKGHNKYNDSVTMSYFDWMSDFLKVHTATHSQIVILYSWVKKSIDVNCTRKGVHRGKFVIVLVDPFLYTVLYVVKIKIEFLLVIKMKNIKNYLILM